VRQTRSPGAERTARHASEHTTALNMVTAGWKNKFCELEEFEVS
jgi:hypothetical protein